MITEQHKKIYADYVNPDISFDDFVKKANEIYFNLEPEMYNIKHPEIDKFEAKRWDALAKKYFVSEKPLRILDVGSGSGFVAEHVCRLLKKEDTFVFYDISEDMLNYCRNRFTYFNCNLEFKKQNSKSLDFPDSSFDMVTLNSVLHHIPDTEHIIREVSRVLKPLGKLIIAHEVNMAFFKNKVIWTNYKILRVLSDRRALLESLSKHTGVASYKRPGDYDVLLEKVNTELLKQNIIMKPLSPAKLGLVMELYASIGFDVDNLANGTDLALVGKKTYNHLNDNPTAWILRLYDKILSLLFPNSGKSFSAVFQKS